VYVWNGTKRPPPRRWGLLRRPLVALVALAAVGVLAAGCGGNGSGGMGGYGSSGTTPASGGASSVATVSATSTSLGTILVDGSGRTLYLFEKDQPNQSACAGACAATWPVDQSSGAPKAGSGVTASMLGTIKRSDNTTQVTYNKHPLYYFHGDSGAGQQNGQGVDAFGAKWFVVNPAGGAVSSGTTANGSGSSGGSGSGGYGY
jgi:predicted lipoprotein with Yx(FWY)xxD motif